MLSNEKVLTETTLFFVYRSVQRWLEIQRVTRLDRRLLIKSAVHCQKL
jgi:hypothetical protein